MCGLLIDRGAGLSMLGYRWQGAQLGELTHPGSLRITRRDQLLKDNQWSPIVVMNKNERTSGPRRRIMPPSRIRFVFHAMYLFWYYIIDPPVA